MSTVEQLHDHLRGEDDGRLCDNPWYFVHIPRNAGTSITESLQYNAHGDQHRTAAEIIGLVGRENWDRKYSFAVVRNPWDRAVSWFFYHCEKFPELPMYQTSLHDWVLAGMPTHWGTERPSFEQWRWVTVDGEVAVRKVYRFEYLGMDWDRALAFLGLPCPLAHLNTSPHDPDYRRYYDDETRDVVGLVCHEDIEQFQYRF